MHLTDEQLHELTQRVNARRAEFNIEGHAAILEPLTVGDVRMAATIYDEYATEVENAYYSQRDKKLEPIKTDANTDAQPREPQLSASAVAVLGPEHTNVTPLRNGNGTHKQAREDRVRAELGEPPKRYDEMPTKEELLREIKRISMAGMMPTMAAFDAARPAVWATAQSHLLRLGVNWTELADEADLTLRRGRSSTESDS